MAVKGKDRRPRWNKWSVRFRGDKCRVGCSLAPCASALRPLAPFESLSIALADPGHWCDILILHVNNIAGMRGLVERNTMRYFLAVEAYLGVPASPDQGHFEMRLRRWFDATELHARQLHEVDRQTFLDIKRRELGAALPSRK
jgi:hypothetical protein